MIEWNKQFYNSSTSNYKISLNSKNSANHTKHLLLFSKSMQKKRGRDFKYFKASKFIANERHLSKF